MSQKEIKESLDLLGKDWSIDPIIRKFMLGEVTDIVDYPLNVKGVIFHVPYLNLHKKYVLWKCFWPDCHNCCDRQGRLPLTSSDLIIIGKGLKYQKSSDFINQETLTTTYQDLGPSGQVITMTTINLKRKKDETSQNDGTHISCRFLNNDGGCSIHPDRPSVCYLYPFSSWIENENGSLRVHASYQITGDCPGFYLDDNIESMKDEFKEYSKIIYNYSMESNRTNREGFSMAHFN